MIDTSTTAGKIAVMQAFEDGKAIQYKNRGYSWVDFRVNTPMWNWKEVGYRIKPQTVEEAAIETANKHFYETKEHSNAHLNGFRAAIQWQKEQDQ